MALGNGTNMWFDGYDPDIHQCVIFDEFKGSVIKKDKLKQLIDIYPIKVGYKGGCIDFIPKYIFINSNRNPLSWYNNLTNTEIKSIIRRCQHLKYYSGSDFKDVVINDLIKENIENNEVNYERIVQLLKELQQNELENIAA